MALVAPMSWAASAALPRLPLEVAADEVGNYTLALAMVFAAVAAVAAAGLAYGVRLSGAIVAGATALVALVGALIWTQGTLSGSSASLLAMAEAGEQVPPEWMINLNPGLIIVAMVFVARLSGMVRPLVSIFLGMIIATVGSVIAGTTTVGLVALFGIAVFSVGEMLSSPKTMEYLATLAKKGQEGLFMGYSNIPTAIGWVAGSILAGTLYEKLGDKVNLARYHLVHVAGMDPAAAAALPKTEVLPTLATRLQLDAPAVQSLLFETYHPERLWYLIGAIGLASILGMGAYDWGVRRADRRLAEAEAAVAEAPETVS
jgi:hypothetical protein